MSGKRKPAEITGVKSLTVELGDERLYRVHYTIQAEPKTTVKNDMSFFAADELDAYLRAARSLRRAGYEL